MGEARLVHRLRELYEAPEWALFFEVGSATGATITNRADAIAVNLWPSRGWMCLLFEEKVSRNDFLREIKKPAKLMAIGRFAHTLYFVVPDPWRNVVHDLDELPEGCGLISVGTGGPRIIRQAVEREAEEPTLDFHRALLRAAATMAERAQVGGDAPTRLISRTVGPNMQLAPCQHWIPAIHLKPRDMPKRVPCEQCAEEQQARRAG